MKRFFIVVLIFATALSVNAQDFQKLDSLSHLLLDKYNLPGIGIVGVQNGEIVYQKAFGKAN